MRLHAIEWASCANGPGLRAVIWFQGCTLGCPDCFNPATHNPLGGYYEDTTTIATLLLAHAKDIDGITFSGGEPFQQADALLELLQRLSTTNLSTLIFSGYTLHEIQQQPLGPAILARVDVLIAGRYLKAKQLGAGLLGSSNQQIHLLTKRYTPADLACTPTAEIILHPNGMITLSGISPVKLRMI